VRDKTAHGREGEKVDAIAKPGSDATPGPLPTTVTPFVVVSATLNVPAQPLPHVNVHETTVESVRPPFVGGIRLAIANTGDPNVATATATTMNKWGRHGYIVAEIHRLIAAIEPPWGSQMIFEAAAMRFPKVDASALRMTVLAVLMTQRQCIRDLTLAGARRGPRRDENGEIFMELDLVYANRYSDSY